MNYIKELEEYRKREIEVLQRLDLKCVDAVMHVLENARLAGNRIYICGNGGSAATASHFAGDFNKGVSENLDIKYSFECLNDNCTSMMAVANDFSYEEIFRYPLRNRMRRRDVLIGISGSGNSKNVVNAFEYARQVGGITVALVGYDGGRLKKMADYCVHVDVNDMQISEDLHMILDHMMMSALCTRQADRQRRATQAL